MKLEEVLPFFRNSKTIYRKAWRDNKKFALCTMYGTIKCKEMTDTYTYRYPLSIGEFTIEDICADDWEVFE